MSKNDEPITWTSVGNQQCLVGAGPDESVFLAFPLGGDVWDLYWHGHDDHGSRSRGEMQLSIPREKLSAACMHMKEAVESHEFSAGECSNCGSEDDPVWDECPDCGEPR